MGYITRKYIDMILKASSKWPNLDFGKDLEVRTSPTNH